MMDIAKEIFDFLKGNGFVCSVQMYNDMEVICTSSPDNQHVHIIIPLGIESPDLDKAAELHKKVEETISLITSRHSEYPLIITEDRWRRQSEMIKARILAHLEIFNPVYARNCEIRRIDRSVAKEFLEANHSYGYATCKYCYGMFLKRHTGHIAEGLESCGEKADKVTYPSPGTLIAVATFSNSRKWIKGEHTIRSYEWTRYASLPDVRLSGGMGRILKTFIKEIRPDDIMSYADLEWSTGDVYAQLGFTLEGQKDPVMFVIDTESWKRSPIKKGTQSEEPAMSKLKYFRNFGSNKYRLKLTDYE